MASFVLCDKCEHSMEDVSKEKDPDGIYLGVWYCPICDEEEYWTREEEDVSDDSLCEEISFNEKEGC